MQIRKHENAIEKHGNTIVEYLLLLGTFAVLGLSSLAVFGQSMISLFAQTGSSEKQPSVAVLKTNINLTAARTRKASFAVGASNLSATMGLSGQALVD